MPFMHCGVRFSEIDVIFVAVAMPDGTNAPHEAMFGIKKAKINASAEQFVKLCCIVP